MNDHLTPLDATFLELEQDDETAHMHIGAALVFDPLPEGGTPPVDQVRSDLERRLSFLPRYRQRLSEPRTGGLSWPQWVDDPDFDIRDHVHHAALPAPGSDEEMLEWLSEYWSHRLDRLRPLWDAYVIEGLRGGRWALVTKTHHCLVDGVGSLDAGYVLLDQAPEAVEPPEPPPSPGGAEPERGILLRLASAGTHGARAGMDAVLHPARLRELAGRARATAELLVRAELIAAPRTSLNLPIGTMRRFELVRVPLADVKRTKSRLGGTVNDVVLCACTGGLRRLLLERGEEPPAQGLRAMVPVNVRQAGEELALGNRITSLFVHLPVAEDTPRMRWARTLEEAEALKSGTQATGGQTLLDVTGLAPPAVHALLARSLFASRLFNVTVTNVPGPQQPLYAQGARLREVYPLVPIAADHALGIAVVSYDGQLFFGINADRETVPDLDVLVTGIEDSLDELREMAATRKVAT